MQPSSSSTNYLAIERFDLWLSRFEMLKYNCWQLISILIWNVEARSWGIQANENNHSTHFWDTNSIDFVNAYACLFQSVEWWQRCSTIWSLNGVTITFDFFIDVSYDSGKCFPVYGVTSILDDFYKLHYRLLQWEVWLGSLQRFSYLDFLKYAWNLKWG